MNEQMRIFFGNERELIMAKKKTVKKVGRISPEIKSGLDGAIYDDLHDGDCFICQGSLWMKQNDCCDQTAICLLDGEMDDNFCEKPIIPVDIQITWKKK